MEVAAITFVETQIRAGRSPRPGADTDFPMVLGNGVAGVVAAVGPGVDPAWAGTTVVGATGGRGGYASLALVAADELHRLPPGVDTRTAAALLADGRTALALARAAALGAGDRVVVTAAAGGVGSLLLQVARQRDAAAVIGLAGGAAKVAVVADRGAVGVDYRQDGWVEEVAAAGGGAVDVVFDGVGGEVGAALVGVLADGGRRLAYGMASGGPAAVDGDELARRHITTVPMADLLRGPADVHALVEEALGEAAAGRLVPVIGQTFPLADAAAAHAAIEDRRSIGKTLLLP